MEWEPGQSPAGEGTAGPYDAGPYDAGPYDAGPDGAVTQPHSSVSAPRWDPPTSREPRRRPSVKLVAALVALLLAVSGALTIAGAVPWPFGQQSQSLGNVIPTPTDFPTIAPTATATPTHTPTPTPVPTIADWQGTPSGPTYTPPGGTVNLGCTPKPTAGPWAISSGIASGHATPREIALTFDDGPGGDTASILNTLDSTHTPATFFIVGVRAHVMPWIVQREWNSGYAIGLHTWDHPDMTTLSPQQRQWEFSSLLQELHTDLGAHACLWFWRPPYGAVNGPVLQDAASYGLTTITWDVDTADWSQPGTQHIISVAVGYAHPGAIILMHDGPAGRGETAAALPTIIKQLRAQGYKLVTVPQLLADSAGIRLPTPTPTPKPTATPTATPTPTPSPSPTDTPTPTATATDTPTATP